MHETLADAHELVDEQARSSFGMFGAYAPILVRSILALLWLVILTCASSFSVGGLESSCTCRTASERER